MAMEIGVSTDAGSISGPAETTATQQAESTQTQASESPWDNWTVPSQALTPDIGATPPATEAPATPGPTEPVSAGAGAEEDEFDKITDPRAQDFQALRGHRNELKAELGNLKPIAQAVQQVGGPQVLEELAPLFQTFPSDHDPTIKEAGIAAVRALATRDPRIGDALVNGTYELYKDSIQQWALEDLGITLDDYQAFQQIQQSGRSVSELAQAPVQQLAPVFPEPDTDGWVTLPDGTELDVGGSAKDKLLYGMARDNWSARQQEAQRQQSEQQGREAAIRHQQQQLEQEAEGRRTAYVTEADRIYSEGRAQIKLDFGAETEFANEVVDSLVREYASRDQTLQTLMAEGMRLSASGGRAAQEKQVEIIRVMNNHLKTAVEKTSKILARVNRPQPQPGQPNLPPGALRPVQPQSSVPPARVAPTAESALDAIWSQVR